MNINKSAWILIENKKVLFARTEGKTLYYNVGGQVEEGESDIECLIREVKEEVGVDLVVDTIKYMETFSGPAAGKQNGEIVNIKCFTANYIGNLKPANEIEELMWFTSADTEKTSPTGKEILEYLFDRKLIN